MFISKLHLVPKLCPVIQTSVNKADRCIRFLGYRFLRLFWGGRRRGSTTKATTAILSRNWNTGCNKWHIINFGTPQGRNTNIQPIVSQGKGVKTVRLHTSLATVCVDVVFHRNFSSAGWTDERVLPAQDTLHDYWSRIRQLHNQFYSENMTWHRFFTRVFCILQTIHRDLMKAKNMSNY